MSVRRLQDFDNTNFGSLDSGKDKDVVFHLAALIAIPYSYDAPSSYVQTNVQNTICINGK